MQNNQELNPSNLSNIYITSQNQTTISIFYIKIFYLIIIWSISFLFGLLPLCFNNCRKDLRLLNYANAFSAGIFLGIGFFHLNDYICKLIQIIIQYGKDSYQLQFP